MGMSEIKLLTEGEGKRARETRPQFSVPVL